MRNPTFESLVRRGRDRPCCAKGRNEAKRKVTHSAIHLIANQVDCKFPRKISLSKLFGCHDSNKRHREEYLQFISSYKTRIQLKIQSNAGKCELESKCIHLTPNPLANTPKSQPRSSRAISSSAGWGSLETQASQSLVDMPENQRHPHFP